MKAEIQFNDKRIEQEFGSQLVDERLKMFLWIMASVFGLIRLTCLIRTDKENEDLQEIAKKRLVPGPAKDSKHLLLPPDRLCLAADFNPPGTEPLPIGWRLKVKLYCDRHFRGIEVVIQDHGSAPHVHAEIDPLDKFQVELL